MGTKTDLVSADYNGLAVSFTEDAWFNATEVAERFGKRPNDWLSLPTTQDYIAGLERRYGKIRYVKTSRARSDRGGGTWLHPKLGVAFARWLDLDFAIWCDEQIDGLIRGQHPHYDWKRMRHEATSSFKVTMQILQMTRQRLGKVDRDELGAGDLDLLAKLENMDSVLIGCGASYDDRKAELEKYAADQRAQHAPALENAA